jgi:hypothetical protein
MEVPMSKADTAYHLELVAAAACALVGGTVFCLAAVIAFGG